TDVTDEELKEIEHQLKDGSVNPRNIKMKLAHMITSEYHGVDGADRAQEEFINVFSNKGIPDDIPEIKGANGKQMVDLLLELGFTQSKGEGKRLIQGGGVKLDNEKIIDLAYVVNLDKDVILQAGKRKFAKLVK
ncbi:tyrosine--tRNA ligase, partial [bacterium]|nr:tyrosine--tRNA ligase [bacterium]